MNAISTCETIKDRVLMTYEERDEIIRQQFLRPNYRQPPRLQKAMELANDVLANIKTMRFRQGEYIKAVFADPIGLGPEAFCIKAADAALAIKEVIVPNCETCLIGGLLLSHLRLSTFQHDDEPLLMLLNGAPGYATATNACGAAWIEDPVGMPMSISFAAKQLMVYDVIVPIFGLWQTCLLESFFEQTNFCSSYSNQYAACASLDRQYREELRGLCDNAAVYSARHFLEKRDARVSFALKNFIKNQGELELPINATTE